MWSRSKGKSLAWPPYINDDISTIMMNVGAEYTSVVKSDEMRQDYEQQLAEEEAAEGRAIIQGGGYITLKVNDQTFYLNGILTYLFQTV